MPTSVPTSIPTAEPTKYKAPPPDAPALTGAIVGTVLGFLAVVALCMYRRHLRGDEYESAEREALPGNKAQWGDRVAGTPAGEGHSDDYRWEGVSSADGVNPLLEPLREASEAGRRNMRAEDDNTPLASPKRRSSLLSHIPAVKSAREGKLEHKFVTY